eukprot:403343044
MLRPQSRESVSDNQTESQYNRSNQTSFNLKDYNHRRLLGNTTTKGYNNLNNDGSVNKFNSRDDISQDDHKRPKLRARDENEDLHEITEGDTESLNILNSEIKSNRLGNIVVSLYWEEKILMVFRFIQFYGYLMLLCFEVWPYQARHQISGLFFFTIGSFHFMYQPSKYYEVIQSINLTGINLASYSFFMILMIITTFVFIFVKKFHYRLLKKRNKFIFYKWGFWFLELIYFPIFTNIIQYSTCQYYSSKDAIQVVNCGKISTTGYSLMLLCALLTFVVAVCYNMMIGIHLYREKVSNILHEDYIVKKEIEYTVGVSEMWNSRYYFTFSSFKGEIIKMYHRVIFNFLQFLLMIAHALMQESQGKIAITVGLLTIFMFYIILARPYRCMHSNILMFMLTVTLLATSFLLLMKKGGMKSALFVESYFYGLLIVVNAFCWFMIVCFLILLLIIKGSWGTNKDKVMKAISGQDYVIFYIKKARKFKRRVLKTKVYEEKESKQLNHLLKVLTEQFNQLRDRQPIILDALLETIEQLKQMKKNYDENKFLYNYDYKDELAGLVKTRYRIYETRDINIGL